MPEQFICYIYWCNHSAICIVVNVFLNKAQYNPNALLLKLSRREEQTRNANSIAYSSVLWCPLRFPHENNVRFVFTSSCLQRGGHVLFILVMLACLWYVVPNTYSVVFLFCLSSSCVLCTQCCQFLWIVHFWLPLRHSLSFIDNSIFHKTRLQLWQRKTCIDNLTSFTSDYLIASLTINTSFDTSDEHSIYKR